VAKIYWREGEVKINHKDSFSRITPGDIIKVGGKIIIRAKVMMASTLSMYKVDLYIEDRATRTSTRAFSVETRGTPLAVPFWVVMGDKVRARYKYYNPTILSLYSGDITMPSNVGRFVFHLRMWRKTWSPVSGWSSYFMVDVWNFLLKTADITIKADQSRIVSGDSVKFTGTAPPGAGVIVRDVNTYVGGRSYDIGRTTADSAGQWELRTPVHRYGPPTDFSLNIIAKSGSLESSPVSIAVSVAGEAGRVVGQAAEEAIAGLAKTMGVGLAALLLIAGVATYAGRR
jgi:hypothetical protein